MNAKSATRERFESAHDALVDLSHRIHPHPELGFEEEQSSSWLCEFLADAGFVVEKGICDLPTAFRATADAKPLVTRRAEICEDEPAFRLAAHSDRTDLCAMVIRQSQKAKQVAVL